MNKLYWWAYLHINGGVQVKRYLDQQDFDDAEESPFVLSFVGPFLAADRDEAMAQAIKFFDKARYAKRS
jgi:hypothetical protein